MDDIEYVGRASSHKMTSIEQDNKAAKTQYRKDILANTIRRTANKESKTVELTRERLPE
jgi:hypothetical protein